MTTIISERVEEARQSCERCAAIADRCAYAMLESASAEGIGACVRKCLDCATICRATAIVLARGSGIASDMCRVCLESCLSCESECARFDDEFARECAEACIQCEDALRAVS